MIREEICREVSKRLLIPLTLAEKVINAHYDVMREALCKGDRVIIPRLMTMTVVNSPSLLREVSRGKTPHKQFIRIPAKRRIRVRIHCPLMQSLQIPLALHRQEEYD